MFYFYLLFITLCSIVGTCLIHKCCKKNNKKIRRCRLKHINKKTI